MNDYSSYIQLILGGALGGVGWFARTIYNDHQKTKDELSNVKVTLAEKYISYDRLKDIMQPVMDALQEIKDTLKTKADK